MNTGPPELWGSIPDGSLSRRLIAQHDGADGGGMPLGSAMSGSDLAGIEIPGDLRPAGTGLVGCHDLSDNLRVQFGLRPRRTPWERLIASASLVRWPMMRRSH